MSPCLGILLYAGFLGSIVFGLKTEPNPPLASIKLTRTSYARGTSFGCSHKFFTPHCWKYCTGNNGNWCYTVLNRPGWYCSNDNDCRYSEACQGWCAWNSQRGCAKACHEEEIVPESQQPRCRRGQPYWECQSNFGNRWRSQLAMEGKWVSPDIPNEKIVNQSENTLTFNGNVATSTKNSTRIPQSALWYPTGPLNISPTTFYWIFTFRNIGTATDSSISIGISDLNKLAPGWSSKGLFYGGNLSDGSGLLIGNFGPTIKIDDEVSMLIKFVDMKMKMYIFLNGQSLGLSYDVPENTLNGIYPPTAFDITPHPSIYQMKGFPSLQRHLGRRNPLVQSWLTAI